MVYNGIVEGVFVERPNRFIAIVEVDGQRQVCHVKNTGRCRELLLPGADVCLQYSDSPSRKTKYDLISVYKGTRLINMDSAAPNKVAYEYLSRRFKGADIKPEVRFGDSRIDFYVDSPAFHGYVEVKGVTLEEDGVVMFPDAPTERGLKHLRELIKAREDGADAAVLFIVQMEKVKYFTPNYKTHPQFGYALVDAEKAGVCVWAIDCKVGVDSITPNRNVPIVLKPEENV